MELSPTQYGEIADPAPAARPSTPSPRGDAAGSEDANAQLARLRPYLKPDACVWAGRFPQAPIARVSDGMRANMHYFSHADWMDNWLAEVHRYPQLRERWLGAAGTLDGKVMVDIGCGPGNLLATLGGSPRLAIGVDIAAGSLERAARVGYVPLLSDAHELPLAPAIADLVAINGSLHHCDDMARVLAEAARLVRPGGLLLTDHDPQQSAWNFRGAGLALWRLRLPLYRWLGRGGHCADGDEQQWALATELHHRPGDGLSEALLRGVLEPRGWQVQVWPHNHDVGREVFDGQIGRPPLKIRVAQRLSGIDPRSPRGALSLFCVARAPG